MGSDVTLKFVRVITISWYRIGLKCVELAYLKLYYNCSVSSLTHLRMYSALRGILSGSTQYLGNFRGNTEIIDVFKYYLLVLLLLL